MATRLVCSVDVTVPAEIILPNPRFLLRLPHLVKSADHKKQKDYKLSIFQDCPHLRLSAYFMMSRDDIKISVVWYMITMKFQSSSLATAIGMNRYEKISKEFERLWRATSSQTFTRAFEKASTKDTQTAIDTAIATTPSGFERVRQAKKMGERAMCTVAVSQNKTEILDKIDEDSKTLTTQKKESGSGWC